MKLIRKDNANSIHFYTDRQRQKNCNWAICVDKEYVPEDFDFNRTARMIEKMPRIVKDVKYLLNQLDFCETFQSTATGLLRDIDYINNGDKEEMVEVSVLPTIHNSKVLPCQPPTNFTKIPKSEAIRLKIIKE